jgi:hypothetical protein
MSDLWETAKSLADREAEDAESTSIDYMFIQKKSDHFYKFHRIFGFCFWYNGISRLVSILISRIERKQASDRTTQASGPFDVCTYDSLIFFDSRFIPSFQNPTARSLAALPGTSGRSGHSWVFSPKTRPPRVATFDPQVKIHDI